MKRPWLETTAFELDFERKVAGEAEISVAEPSLTTLTSGSDGAYRLLLLIDSRSASHFEHALLNSCCIQNPSLLPGNSSNNSHLQRFQVQLRNPHIRPQIIFGIQKPSLHSLHSSPTITTNNTTADARDQSPVNSHFLAKSLVASAIPRDEISTWVVRGRYSLSSNTVSVVVG